MGRQLDGEALVMDIVRCGAYHKCAVCGKRFFVRFPDDWIYRRNKQHAKTRLYMCSWHCLREYDSTHTDLWSTSNFIIDADDMPTHWMPLPMPPESEET